MIFIPTPSPIWLGLKRSFNICIRSFVVDTSLFFSCSALHSLICFIARWCGSRTSLRARPTPPWWTRWTAFSPGASAPTEGMLACRPIFVHFYTIYRRIFKGRKFCGFLRKFLVKSKNSLLMLYILDIVRGHKIGKFSI